MTIFLYILKILFFIFVPFIILISIWLLKYYFIDKLKFIKGSYRYVGFGNFFTKLFYQFPKQFAYDIITRNPDEFRDYGFNLITGKQGSGKTITLVYLLLRYQKMYPKLKVMTNMYYKYEDDNISHWKDFVCSDNGIYGEIIVLDEVQNWFSSNQSKDFPPEMLREITQQRKQKKMILGTTQVFTRVAKPIRENVYLVYEPFTILGCITIVRKYEPVLDDNGTLIKQKFRGMFWFVHTHKVRSAFDTYKKILDMSKSGFIDSSKQMSNCNYSSTSVVNYYSSFNNVLKKK